MITNRFKKELNKNEYYVVNPKTGSQKRININKIVDSAKKTLKRAVIIGLAVGTLGTGALSEINKNFSNGAGSGRYSKFNSAKSNIWGVLLTVLQVASIAGVIFAGVRYMFASSDSKADMKKSMIYLIIGMVIVFSASTVVGITTRTFNDIVSPLNR